MVTIHLPRNVYEDQFYSFLLLLGEGNLEEEIVYLDFINVNQYTPMALTCLAIKICKWLNKGVHVEFLNHEQSPSFTYLQRIDFFKLFKIDTTEHFNRHDSGGRFVPITLISGDVGDLSTQVAECIAPELADSMDPNETGFFNCIEYSISELGNNTQQHAQARHSILSSQYYPTTDLIRVSIADNGMGIQESFRTTGSPHADNINNDLEAIKKALEPSVSSKKHLFQWGESVNAGVGLSLLKELAQHLNGHFILVSGNGYYSISENREELFNDGFKFEGTLCSFTFPRNSIHNFHNLLYTLKQELGLINENGEHEDLEDLFL